MAKQMKNKIIVLGMILLIAIFMTTFISAATMERSVPLTASPGSTFQITYTTTGASGNWGASIVDVVSGGCTFPNQETTYKSVMLSTDGNTKTITMTAPSSGSCTFIGDYKFGIENIIVFPDKIITFSGICTPNCSGKLCGDNGCGGICGTCSIDKTCSNGQCISEPTTFDWNKVLFSLGTFEIKLWMALLIVGIILLILILKK